MQISTSARCKSQLVRCARCKPQLVHRLEVGTTFHSTTFQSNKINSNERAQCACLCGARISIQDRKGVRSQGHIQEFKFGGGGGGGGGGVWAKGRHLTAENTLSATLAGFVYSHGRIQQRAI